MLIGILLGQLLLFFTISTAATISCPAYDHNTDHAQTILQEDSVCPQCRCFPGDACWPWPADWDRLNQSVNGRLIATLPLASVCYNTTSSSSSSSSSTYDKQACETLREAWADPKTHYTSPSSPMHSWYANNSCTPFFSISPEARCVLGTYPRYVVNASSDHALADYRATLAFAAAKNIRLVIRNTGHDLMGKSTGAGALALWTHHLKDIEVIPNYSSSPSSPSSSSSSPRSYTGPAMKLGAGVQAFEAYAAAHAANLTLNGGDCDTVGLVGGYTQGGGLGPLTSLYGLAADQVLAWEAVTASGQHILATPASADDDDDDDDLYWALSGGGGGTYAAVLSVTVRAHPALQTVAAANLTFSRAVGRDPESGDDGVGLLFSGAVQRVLLALPRLADRGSWCNIEMYNGVFELKPVLAPGLTAVELGELLAPVLEFLKLNGILYEYHIQQFPSYLDAFTAMIPTYKTITDSLGGRLIPRSLFQSAETVAPLVDALAVLLDAGALVSCIVSTQARFPTGGGMTNSVSPALRSSLVSVVFGLPSDETNHTATIQAREKITHHLVPQLERITPGSGAYLNEADPNQPHWQHAFYGHDNYARLLKIKDRYDPGGLFYGLTAVGSERWAYRMDTDGRLCRKG